MKKKSPILGNSKLYIILGFIFLYIVGMILITHLTKEQYSQETLKQIDNVCNLMIADIEDLEIIKNEDGSLSDYYLDHMQYILSVHTEQLDQYAFIGAGLLDPDGNLLAQTSDCFFDEKPTHRDGKPSFHLINLHEYFTEEEEAIVRDYYYQEKQQNLSNVISNKRYVLYVAYDKEKEDLVHFYIKERETRKKADGAVIEVPLGFVFDWRNSKYIGKDIAFPAFEKSIESYMIYPYLQHGEKYWEIWKSNSHLHNYFEGTEEEWLRRERNVRYYEKYEETFLDWIYLGDNSEKTYDPNYVLVTNIKLYPWQAAFDQLQEIYLYSACFVALCMAIVLYFTDKTTKKQLQLEQTRRDITNAVAHELKPPLAIVRNLFENMERETSEEKNSYYRQEGIRQTEVMDDLIKEMIFISKIDSDKIKLRQETISILSILEDQLNKLDPMIDEKNLHLQFWKEEDFTIIGDRVYLEKAVFNLLENAVSYNKPDGRISIRIEKDTCLIENTADPIPEEDLPHVFDIFFTSNKSRKSDVNHKGLGLYLAKRILDMHGLRLTISNSDIGVQVTLNRK